MLLYFILYSLCREDWEKIKNKKTYGTSKGCKKRVNYFSTSHCTVFLASSAAGAMMGLTQFGWPHFIPGTHNEWSWLACAQPPSAPADPAASPPPALWLWCAWACRAAGDVRCPPAATRADCCAAARALAHSSSPGPHAAPGAGRILSVISTTLTPKKSSLFL